MGHLHEETALGSALSVDGDRSADVAAGLETLASIGRDGQVNRRMGECAGVGAAEEVLDEGAEAVEFEGCGVPAEQGLAGIGLERQGEHRLLVVNIDLDLVLLFGVRDGEA